MPYLAVRTRYNNPIKVLEYLSCGRPVVTARNPSIDDYPNLYFYEGGEEFVARIDEAAGSAIDGDTLYQNLKSHTWDARLDSLLATVYRVPQRPGP